MITATPLSLTTHHYTDMLAKTPEPPYYAVIFTSVRSAELIGYDEMAAKMSELVSREPGFLGMEHAASDGLSVTVCYWDSLESIAAWKQNAEHAVAQQIGRDRWYRSFATRIVKVERETVFESGESIESGKPFDS